LDHLRNSKVILDNLEALLSKQLTHIADKSPHAHSESKAISGTRVGRAGR